MIEYVAKSELRLLPKGLEISSKPFEVTPNRRSPFAAAHKIMIAPAKPPHLT